MLGFYTLAIFIAFVLLSEYSISAFQKSRLFVAEAFSNVGKENRIRFLRPVCAHENLESWNENCSVVQGQPPYEIAGKDLSASWIDLVRQNQVSASVSLKLTKSNIEDNSDEIKNVNSEGDDKNSMVEYGIRLVEKKTDDPDETRWVFEEYVQQLGLESGDLTPNPLISNINATLARILQQTTGSALDIKRVGNFVAQLQLVRTLRPPPSEGFRDATTSDPPPYNPKTDSFVTGPLRLDLRPLVGRLNLPSTVNDHDADDKNKDLLKTSWDVFHNISPADRRGHFLFLPTLLNKERNWRGQYLTEDDCHDLVHLTSTVEPVGSMFLGYNSVGAGASQNHIHCHSWPYPSIDSTRSDIENDASKEVSGNPFYAVNNVDAIYDFYDVDGGKVEVSYLNYPVFCVQMSSSVANLDLLGRALATCLEAIGEAPHNVGFLNSVYQIEDGEERVENEKSGVEVPIAKMVDIFIFARSKERSCILPTLKLGISEMMGVFHAQSEAELGALATINTVLNDEDGSFERKGAMEQVLADISYENEEELWDDIVTRLVDLDNDN